MHNNMSGSGGPACKGVYTVQGVQFMAISSAGKSLPSKATK